MADAQVASEAARTLVARRWGNQVAIKAAETVIRRAAELPASVRAEVREAVSAETEASDGG